MKGLRIFDFICLAGRTPGILLSCQQSLPSSEPTGLLWQKKCFYPWYNDQKRILADEKIRLWKHQCCIGSTFASFSLNNVGPSLQNNAKAVWSISGIPLCNFPCPQLRRNRKWVLKCKKQEQRNCTNQKKKIKKKIESLCLTGGLRGLQLSTVSLYNTYILHVIVLK